MLRLWPRAREDRIEEAFAFLLSCGYRLVAKSAWGMGGRVTYRSGELWIGIEWDRSDPWLDFAPVGSGDSHDWDLMDHLLKGERHFRGTNLITPTARVPELASFLRDRLPEIEACFREPRRAATIAQLASLRAERAALFEQRP